MARAYWLSHPFGALVTTRVPELWSTAQQPSQELTSNSTAVSAFPIKPSQTTVLLLGLLAVEGQCLPLINLPRLEVEDGHRVHFHIIEADFGVGAVVCLGEEKNGAHSTTGLTHHRFEKKRRVHDPPATLAFLTWTSTYFIPLRPLLDHYFVISKH